MVYKVYSAIKTDGTMLAISTNLQGLFEDLRRATGDRELFVMYNGEQALLTPNIFRRVRDENIIRCSRDFKQRMQKLADDFEFELNEERMLDILNTGIPVFFVGETKPRLFLRDDPMRW